MLINRTLSIWAVLCMIGLAAYSADASEVEELAAAELTLPIMLMAANDPFRLFQNNMHPAPFC